MEHFVLLVHAPIVVPKLTIIVLPVLVVQCGTQAVLALLQPQLNLFVLLLELVCHPKIVGLRVELVSLAEIVVPVAVIIISYRASCTLTGATTCYTAVGCTGSTFTGLF